MCNFRDKKADKFRALVIGMVNNLFPVAHADDGGDGGSGSSTDPNGTGGNPNNPAMINYEELIARARKEEKDKLYGVIDNYKTQVKTLTKSNNEQLLKIGTLETELEQLKQSNGESEEVQNLKARILELESENTQLKETNANAPDENAIREQVKAEYEVQLYRVQQLGNEEVKSAILPMFLDSIKGTTKEEIDAAIEDAKSKTAQAREQLGVNTDALNGAGNSNPNNLPNGVGNIQTGSFNRPPVANPASPTHNGFGDNTDWDYVRNLDPASPEYAEWRRKVGLR